MVSGRDDAADGGIERGGAVGEKGDPLRLAIESGNARLLSARGRHGEALEAQRALIERWSQVLSLEAPDLLELRRDEVHTLMQLGRRPEARSRMQALLPAYERSFGAKASATLSARLTFANLTNMLNDYEVSLREARAVARERERALGHDHPDTLQALALVGANRVRLAQEEPAFAEVEIAMRDLLQRQQRILGRDHPQTLASMSDLVRLLGKQGDRGKSRQAIALQRQIMLARQRTLGELHLDSVVALGALASLQAHAGMRDDAVRNARLALERYEKVVPGHRWISATWDVIGRAEFNAGNLPAARDAHHQALVLRAEQGGPFDAHTIESASRLYVALYQLSDRESMEQVRRRYLEPVIALEPTTLNAAMLDIRESALLALQGVPK